MQAFKGELAFLSNMYPVPHGIMGFPTVEHYYVACKPGDHSYDRAIKACKHAGEVKRLGRTIKLRADWDDVKLGIMEFALRRKFELGTDLAARLINTGDKYLEETNYWHDNYWGNCTCNKCIGKPGLNNLGLLLMKIRRELIFELAAVNYDEANRYEY